MINNKQLPYLLFLIMCIYCNYSNVSAQSSITIDASQQITNFAFADAAGDQESTLLMFGNDGTYKPEYSGAYSLGYAYSFDFNLFIKANVGMRNAGASMVYDDINYSWDFRYLQTKIGVGYAYDLGMFKPYIAVSGYYGYLLTAEQSINNENFDIRGNESIKSADVGLNIPLGVRIDANDLISVYTEAAYVMGLYNIETDESGQNAKNVAYQFTLGLAFAIDK